MNIEEKCNELIDVYNEGLIEDPCALSGHEPPHAEIEYWMWLGVPAVGKFPDNLLMFVLNSIIKNWDTTECLTSKSEYIRECKKYYLKNE